MSRVTGQEKLDVKALVEVAAFRRFLFRIVDAAGIGIPAVKDDMALRMEGRRALGLEILGWVEAALPDTTGSAQPLAALHLALSEALAPKETKREARNRYDEDA
ncbi:hypothetical protein [Sphingobium sp. CAP-1]|uniref:hypothetical protein n=1 Tax=Sphingobium sp. CAP-1 TaxID=2676077 RepID=UPI0012BB2180|nr:hypothetical protein [Sphingobium sp. CAP-1]QGP80010.1 hypothetical protein GL174_14215 [Sphingobium sp. CAP-1]